MRVFLAGATGALGQHLVPHLVQAGHEVIGTTRSASKIKDLEAAGAQGVVLDGLDREGTIKAVTDARPDVVMHQLTALGNMKNPAKFDTEFALTNRFRTEGLDILLDAAQQAGAKRFVAQSYTGWPNARTGALVKTEDDPLDEHPGKNSRETLAAIKYLERAVTAADDVEGVVLRYGGFYGPGTGMTDQVVQEMLRKRRFPIIGGGAGLTSFVHIDDAAAATALAVDRGAPGIYNIVDDEPAAANVYVPFLAQQVGAKPPRKVPAWLIKPLVGEHLVLTMTASRGSSNAKAKRDLGWTPTYPSWRQGFPASLRR